MAHATDALLAEGAMLALATGTGIPLPDGRGTNAAIEPVNGYVNLTPTPTPDVRDGRGGY